MTKKKRDFKLFFYYLLNIPQQKQNKGFTLTELLIAVFMSAIVISTLLTAMVQILQADRRENQRTQVQQQTQSALNYITQDLKQAVYVYDTADIAQYIPDLSAQNATPVLVFWKNQTIKDERLNYTVNDCDNTFSGNDSESLSNLSRCKNLLFKRSQYVLVAYYQSTQDSDTWDGKSRILRYELPKFSQLSSGDLNTKITNISTGYVDPGEISNNFTAWPKDNNNQDLQALNAGGRPTATPGERPVLVDFIDSPNSADFKEKSKRLDCDTLPRIEDPDNPGQFIDRYVALPSDNSSDNSLNNSFYVCVRTVADPNNQSLLGTKQNVAIYLRGNEEKKDESNSNDPFRPVVQTQITIGGIINK